MKAIKAGVILILLLNLYLFSLSQKSQNIQFEKCKGKLPFPACTIYGYNDSRCKGPALIEPGFMNIGFITDSIAEIKAIHAGRVSKIFAVEDGYAVVINFGDYYITYYPLTEPALKKGDVIISGQPISRVSPSCDVSEINILMSKTTEFIDPYKWFRW